MYDLHQNLLPRLELIFGRTIQRMKERLSGHCEACARMNCASMEAQLLSCRGVVG